MSSEVVQKIEKNRSGRHFGEFDGKLLYLYINISNNICKYTQTQQFNAEPSNLNLIAISLLE